MAPGITVVHTRYNRGTYVSEVCGLTAVLKAIDEWIQGNVE